MEVCLIFLVDKYFSAEDRKQVKRVNKIVKVYILMFMVTGLIYIISPNVFAFVKYAFDSSTNLTPETAKIEYNFSAFRLER